MANSVTFPPSLGGSGLTVTDDSNPTTGLANGGHRARLVPALSQVVAVAGNTVTKATEAAASALTASNAASSAAASATSANTSANSATTSATSAAASASAASTSASNAATSASSATASAVLAGDWAIKINGPVTGGEYSAKYHAQAAEDSREQVLGYAETIIAMTNIDFGGFSVVDGELLTTYVDLANSVPSIVDGEFVITY